MSLANIMPEHDVIYVDTFYLFHLGTYFSIRGVVCHLTFIANQVRSAEVKVWSHWQAFLLAFTIMASTSLDENIFPALLPLTTTFWIINFVMCFCLLAVVSPFMAPPLEKMIFWLPLTSVNSSILYKLQWNRPVKVAKKCQLMCWSFIVHHDISSKLVRTNAELMNSTTHNVAA